MQPTCIVKSEIGDSFIQQMEDVWAQIPAGEAAAAESTAHDLSEHRKEEQVHFSDDAPLEFPSKIVAATGSVEVVLKANDGGGELPLGSPLPSSPPHLPFFPTNPPPTSARPPRFPAAP